MIDAQESLQPAAHRLTLFGGAATLIGAVATACGDAMRDLI